MTLEKIVEVLIPLMIPLQTTGQAAPPPPQALGGGPEDVFAFLYWLMQRPLKKRPSKPKLPLSRRTRRLLKLLKALDAARTLQLARAEAAGIFTSA